MRIVVDCRYTRIDQHDGISRYTANLVEALAQLHPVTMLISDHRQLANLPDLPWQLISSPTGPREPWVARQINQLRPDVVFTPMQTMGSWGRRYALLKTVHDLIYYTNRTPPRDLPWPVRVLWRLYHLAWWPQRMLLNGADGVVSVSETTKRLIESHHLTDKPIWVVSNAAAPLPGAERTEVRSPPARTRLVYMGSFMPYKNVDTLVRAVALLPDAELHLMSRVSDVERARLTALAPGAPIVFHNGATDADYAATLESATALVTASLDEGFGIPVVEAMSVGTPVVISDIPIFREIGGEAALFFDPTSPEALVAALRRLEDPAEWRRRSALGRERSRAYTWQSSARELLAAIEATAAGAPSRAGRRAR